MAAQTALLAAAADRATRELWEARALALAGSRHVDGTACLTRENAAMRVYWTPNGDRRGTGYVVVVFPVTRHIVCPCPAGAFGKPCAHAGAVIHAERQRAYAESHPDTDVLASWRRGFDW